jgi:hypothetical protein
MNARAAALVLALAGLFALGLYLYFSPFQQCVRDLQKAGTDRPAGYCLQAMGGK